VIDPAKLKVRNVKALAEMARKKGVAGWHSMRKEQLIRALIRRAKSEASATLKRAKTNGLRKPAALGGANHNGASHRVSAKQATAGKARSARVQGRLRDIKAKLALSKDLAIRDVSDGNGCTRDRLVLMVRDPFWLHVYWELTRASLDRARAAMGEQWHGAKPMLRLHEVTPDGTTNSTRRLIRQVEIHGGVNNWYLDVQDPPKSFQVDVGYLGVGGKFYALARSNVVRTPAATASEKLDHNWAGIAQDGDRIYALSGGYAAEGADRDLREVFEQRLHRPMGVTASQFSLGPANGNGDAFHLKVDAELVVFGTTEPDASVTLRGQPVRLQPDGSFKVRFNLPDRRQVLPVVASRGDGSEQQTVVLAVERNTKVMEPVLRDGSD